MNFGGDLRVSGPRRDGSPWMVAIEDVDRAGIAAGLLELSGGALAISGDTCRYVLRDGVRYGHVLNPKTGWPIADAPKSVTRPCRYLLGGGTSGQACLVTRTGAEAFLSAEKVRAWCVR